MRIWVLSLLAGSSSMAALNSDGLMGVHQIFSAASPGNLHFGVELGSLFSNDEQNLDGGKLTYNGSAHDVNSYFTATSQATLGVGVGSYGELAMSLPVYYEHLEGGGLSIDQPLTGDLQVRFKAELPIHDQKVFHLAMVLGGTAPTAQDGGVIPRRLELFTNDPATFNQGSTPFGSNAYGVLGALGATFDFAALEPSKIELRWHINGGARMATVVSDPPFENIVFGGTALEWGVNAYLLLAAEVYHESRMSHVGAPDWLQTEPTTLTLLATARTPVGFQFQAGAVVGLGGQTPIPVSYGPPPGNRFGLRSAPQIGIYAQVEWSGFLLAPDRDGDGIPDSRDKCPDQPEDFDGFEDQDGCPDLDNDHDGIPDAKDMCPNEPEDFDGFQDQDGCPDPDNDHDGIPDVKDKCPNEPQGPNGVDGCPVKDADGDGILDDKDKCVNDPEDKDGFQDEDGCPDPDNDGDGICDPWVAQKGLSAKYAPICKGSDKCPDGPETVNGFQDDDGCPDTVAVKTKEIVKTMILKGVNFRSGSSELTPESFSVLDDVVKELLQNPQTVFEISGHTDDRGSSVKNQMLSQARAQTVANYFIVKGVDAKRLKAMGYGSAKPIATNRTGAGRALNRRVELNRIQ